MVKFCSAARRVIRKTLGRGHYVSPTWWHLTGYRKSEEAAFETLVAILASQKILARTSQVTLASVGDDADEPKQISVIEGPRACLADIPVEYLEPHGKRYGAFGLGLSAVKVRELQSNEVNPVLYTFEYLQAKLVPAISGNHPIPFKHVQPFLKLCDQDESFDNLYLEREWRSSSDIPVNHSTLESIIVPSSYRKRAKNLLREHDLSSCKLFVWEKAVGDLPTMEFL